MSKEFDQETLGIVVAVKRALLELQCYQTTHTVDEALGRSVQALVGAGALSSETAAFIADHQVRFSGFKARPISQDIQVFEVVLADRTAPLRVVGFRDGHIEVKSA